MTTLDRQLILACTQQPKRLSRKTRHAIDIPFTVK